MFQYGYNLNWLSCLCQHEHAVSRFNLISSTYSDYKIFINIGGFFCCFFLEFQQEQTEQICSNWHFCHSVVVSFFFLLLLLFFFFSDQLLN